MVLDVSWLGTQHYKERIKGKVGQSWERSSALPYTLTWCSSYRKRTFGSPSIIVANFTNQKKERKKERKKEGGRKKGGRKEDQISRKKKEFGKVKQIQIMQRKEKIEV